MALILVALVLAAMAIDQAALGVRMKETAAEPGGIGEALFSARQGLWYRASLVIREFPLTGLGFGAFRTEIPNIMGIKPGEGFYRDNAANWFLQVLAETGPAGLLAGLAVFGSIAGKCIGALGRSGEKLEDTAAAWPAAGLLALLALFITGPHLDFPSVQLLFWTLAGIVVVLRPEETTPWAPGRRDGVLLMAGALLLALHGGLLLERSLGPLSTRAMTGRPGIAMSAGMYPPQRDAGGQRSYWTRREGWILLPSLAEAYETALTVMHPDAAERTVTVKIFLEGELVEEMTFDEPGQTRPLRLEVPETNRPRIEVRFRVSRPFIPAKETLGSTDRRELGVLVEEFRPVQGGS